MIKVQVICERCGSISELVPETRGQHAYVDSNLLKKKLYVSEVNIECSTTDDIEDVTYFDDISIDKELKEVRIDCRQCGDYIVLTDFGQ